MKNSELKYEFINEMPDWINLDEQKRVINIETDEDKSLFGTNLPIEVKVTLGDLTETISFAMIFIERAEEMPAPEPEEEEK